MERHSTGQQFRNSLLPAAALAVLVGMSVPGHARVTRIIVDAGPTTLAADPTYQTITGRAFGELDPNDANNALITDIALAPRNANGKVEYIASFFIVKPIDMSQASGLMWHDVPNRGGSITITADLRNPQRCRAEQRLAGRQRGRDRGARERGDAPVRPVTPSQQRVGQDAGAHRRDRARSSAASSTAAAPIQPLNVMGNPIPYFPADSTRQHRRGAENAYKRRPSTAW